MEAKIRHLEMIQGVISRMAGNLFFLKGWAITLIAALFALAAKDSNGKYMVIAYFPIIIFWVLDGYFLSQERLYRALYDDVRQNKEDFAFSMSTAKYKDDSHNSWLCSVGSQTLLWFYVPLILIMLVIMYWLNH